jgi:uncharacterized protein (TIGR03083 family)
VRLSPERYRESLILNGRAFAAAVAHDRRAAVAACPEWDTVDLLWHLTRVHWFFGKIVEEQALDVDATFDLERPPDEGDLAEMYDRNLDRLLRVLDATLDSTPVWTWAPQRDVAWVRRRMAQETAIHRWDAEAATGTPAPIDTDLAEDGIDEFLTFFVDPEEPPGLAVEVAETGRRYELGSGATARGSASDLLLVLWRRIPPVALDVDDSATLDRFLTRLDLE